MKRYIYIIMISILAGLSLVACQEKFHKDWTEVLVDSDTYNVGFDTESMIVTIWYSHNWTASVISGSDWLTLDKTSGSDVYDLHLIFGVNKGLSRRAQVLIQGDGSQKTVTVTQKGGVALPKIVFETKELSFPAGSFQTEVVFDSNIPGNYFKEVGVTARFPEGVEPWISDLSVSDREEPLESEDMPDGKKHFLNMTVAANSLAVSSREAWVVLKLVNATGAEYADSMKVIQTDMAPYITPAAKDVVNLPGGHREVAISTNVEFESSKFVLTVNYPDPAVTGFVTNPAMKGKILSYDVSENTGSAYRYASINISYTDIAGNSICADQQIEQNVTPEDFRDYHITTLDQLTAWNSAFSKWQKTDKVYLEADIDLSGVNWLCHDFPGTFDGGNHRLYNFKPAEGASMGFFSCLTGTLKNLVIGSSDGTTYDGVSAFNLNTDGGVPAYAGVIARADSSATMSGVVNFAAANITASSSKTRYVGGVCGEWASSGVISNCTNYGNITCSTGSVAAVNIAGVIAQAALAQEATIAGCKNYGTVRNNLPSGSVNTTTVNMGGVLAFANITVNMTGCENSGRVVSEGEGSATHDFNIGGVAGYLQGSDMVPVLDGCVNKGEIINTVISSSNMRIGGVCAYFHANTIPTLRNCSNSGAVTNTAANTHNSETGALCQGGIAGLIAGKGTVTKCSNSGKVSDTNTATTNIYSEMGGIVGRINGEALLQDCTNSGEILRDGGSIKNLYAGGIYGCTLTSTSPSKIINCDNSAAGIVKATCGSTSCIHLGGIGGYSKVAAVLEDCDNAADITTTGDGVYTYFAGVLGRLEVAGGSITNCTNSGDVVNTGGMGHATNHSLRFGGIVGQTRYITIDGCTNTGDVKNTSSAVSTAVNMGGIAGLNNSSPVTIQNCKVTGCEITSASTGAKNIGAICATTVATVVKKNGVGAINVNGTTLTSDNFQNFLSSGSGSAVKSDNYFIK